MAKQDYSRFTFTSEKDPSSGGYGKLIDQQHDIRLIERAVKASLPEDAFYKIVKRAQSKSGKTTIDVYVHQDQSAVAKKGITEAEKELVFKGSDDKKYKVVKARSVSTDTVKQLSHEEKLSEKEKERKEDRKENAGFRLLSSRVSKIIGVLGLITDIVRRILSATLQNAVQTSKDMVTAHNLGISYRQAREAGFVEKAHGLEAGTITGAVSGIQTAFGNITTLDEKSLEALAVVMGSQIKDMALAGVGASDPMKMLESIVNAFNAQANAGLNSIGRYVGQEQARKELYTYLKKFMPEVADIFAKMQEEQHSVNSVFRDVKDFGTFWSSANPNRVGFQNYELNVVATTGELENKVSAVLEQLKKGILVMLAPELNTILRRIANIRWGMTEAENAKLNKENNEKNQKELDIVNKRLAEADKIGYENLDIGAKKMYAGWKQYAKILELEIDRYNKKKDVADVTMTEEEQKKLAENAPDTLFPVWTPAHASAIQAGTNMAKGYVEMIYSAEDPEVQEMVQTTVGYHVSEKDLAKFKASLVKDREKTLYRKYLADTTYSDLMDKFKEEYKEGVRDKTINPDDYQGIAERYAWEQIYAMQQADPNMPEFVQIQTDSKGRKIYKAIAVSNIWARERAKAEAPNISEAELTKELIKKYAGKPWFYKTLREATNSAMATSVMVDTMRLGATGVLDNSELSNFEGKSIVGYDDYTNNEVRHVLFIDINNNGVYDAGEKILLTGEMGESLGNHTLGKYHYDTATGKGAITNVQGAGDGASTLAK